MKTNILPLLSSLLLAAPCMAQQIDFNIASRKPAEVTAPKYTPVGLKEAASQQFAACGLDIWVEAPVKGQTVRSNWYKQGIQQGDRLVGDGIAVSNAETAACLRLIIKGLATGHHSLLAYHNILDGLTGLTPTVTVSVDGKEVLTGVEQTVRQMLPSLCGQSYVEFDAKEGQPVVITYQAQLEKGKTYDTKSLTINGLVFDRANPKKTALNPYPSDDDLHADADQGQLTLRWQAGEQATKHHIYIGTREGALQKVGSTTATEYTATGLTSAQEYFWRVDEEDAAGKISEGEVWNFRPRRLAFPTAEGYGRYATGGRGGVVYHVTSLSDDPANPQPGTLRYGITRISGPRTIVFDISGIIALKDRLVCSDPYITVAGQTAPGKGILLTEHPFGFGSEGIFRFLRLRLGKRLDKDGKTITLDGMGAAGCDNTIIDHCSVGWTIDEAFSSRNGRNISFQHNLISEALNKAGHQNYVGAQHGYAATIGGNVGSFHHNLLAHNEGRNWSMGGGLDGAGYYAGRLDLFNNVVYNWGKRACDGGAHEVNFVGNYYKMGPATTMKYILNAQLEGTGKGSQAYYLHNNIRENTDGTKVPDREGETYQYTTKNHQVVDWQVFTSEPFFPSYANVETAEAAYKNVLSDVGANQPCQDEHDQRMVSETLAGSYKYVGSQTGKKGLIDDNLDAGNDAYKEFEGTTQVRPADWDTDQDGMPDWWEQLTGTNPQKADNNENAADGYTQLEAYLNWLAEPHFLCKAGEKLTIDLRHYFAGYDNAPSYSIDTALPYKLKKDGTLTLRTGKKAQPGLHTVRVTATDKDGVSQLTRTFHIAIR